MTIGNTVLRLTLSGTEQRTFGAEEERPYDHQFERGIRLMHCVLVLARHEGAHLDA